MKKIIPLTDQDIYEEYSEGIEFILDKATLWSEYQINADNYTTMNSLRTTIKNAIDKNKMVIPITVYEHSAFAFYYGVDSTRDWDKRNGWLIIDKNYYTRRPDINFITDLYNGWLYEVMNEDGEVEEVITSSEAWKLAKQDGYQMYDYKTVEQLVPVN